jgi:hypothetical protein
MAKTMVAVRLIENSSVEIFLFPSNKKAHEFIYDLQKIEKKPTYQYLVARAKDWEKYDMDLFTKCGKRIINQ